MQHWSATRRGAVILAAGCCLPQRALAAEPDGARWMRAAEQQKERALSWGDQAYGAVLVKDDRIIGHGPSRVVKNRDPDAHAEREAIEQALSAVGAQGVKGAVLYSTSRPCGRCEDAAARAGVGRMIFGTQLQDAGVPKPRGQALGRGTPLVHHRPPAGTIACPHRPPAPQHPTLEVSHVQSRDDRHQ